VKALQRKEQNCGVVYGLPSLEQVSGKGTIIDLSSMEQSFHYTKAGLEVTSNTTVADFIERLVSLAEDQKSNLTRELVLALRRTRTPQWRAATGLGDALALSVEVQVMLLAVGAKVVASSTPASMGLGPGEKTLELEEVVKMVGECTLKSLFIPAQPPSSHLMIHRVAPRKANPSGLTCAAFSVTLKGEVISGCRLYVGREKREEGRHEGKLDTAMRLLEGKNLSSLEEWMGDIRKMSGDTLVRNLIFKMLQNLKVITTGSSADRKRLEEERNSTREMIQSTQFSEVGWDAGATSTSPLGESVPLAAGLQLATGQAIFVEDMPSSTNELFMAPVCSTKAHARLVSVDPTEALALPGVVRFLSAKDVPDHMKAFKINGDADEDIFADKFVLYEGHPIGAVVASSEKVARSASAMVRVDYEELTPILTIEDAVAASSYIEVKYFFLLSLNELF
jgi:hypothetical protein